MSREMRLLGFVRSVHEAESQSGTQPDTQVGGLSVSKPTRCVGAQQLGSGDSDRSIDRPIGIEHAADVDYYDVFNYCSVRFGIAQGTQTKVINLTAPGETAITKIHRFLGSVTGWYFLSVKVLGTIN